VTSVAEHVVMSILLLARNFVPAHEMAARGDWQVSDIARNAFDLEGKVVGTIGAGRIGRRVLQRLLPFNCKELLYYDYAPLPEHAQKEVNARRVEDLKVCSLCYSSTRCSHDFPQEFVSQCDIVTINCPLHEGTRGLANAELPKHFKKGAWIVNTAHGAICDKDAIADAVKSGHINGYADDVWNVQPAPKDHSWRTMKNPLGGGNSMVPHYSGTTLDAQDT
jgi:formate dehydrogenase